MSGINIKLQPANNVVATGLATIDLANLLGTTVERITLQLGGTAFTKAMITGIQLKANGKIIWDTTGPARDTSNLYRKIPALATMLTLDFSEIFSKTELGQNLGSIDTTQGFNSLKLEIAIAGATAPTLQGWAECNRPQVDPQQVTTRGLIARVHSSNVTIGGSGQFALPVPHFQPADGGGSIFKRILVFSANMTGVLIKKNGIVIEETVKAVNDFRQGEYLKSPQTGLYVIDFVVDNNQSGVLTTRDAQTMEILGTFSAGETIRIESELLETLAAF